MKRVIQSARKSDIEKMERDNNKLRVRILKLEKWQKEKWI